MRIIAARVIGNPREVQTRYGYRSTLDVATAQDGNFTIWRPAGDREVLGRRDGERVSIGVSSNGKASLVEHCSSHVAPAPAAAPPARPLGFAVEQDPEVLPEPVQSGGRSAEIADYIQRLGGLYGHCLSAANNIPRNVELGPEQIKDIATTLFIQTTRHFNL